MSRRSRVQPPLPRLAVLALSFAALTACGDFVKKNSPDGGAGQPDANLELPDAGPLAQAVGGTVTGLDEGQSIELSLNGGGEILQVAANGDFVFDSKLEPSSSYVVTVHTEPVVLDCAVANAAGTIELVPVNDVLVNCSPSAALTDLRVEELPSSAIDFAPDTLGYAVDTSIIVQRARIVATAADPNATITVNGVDATSGEASSPVALGLGGNDITIQVNAQNGASETYTLVINRAAVVAEQIIYGKGSNTEGAIEGDKFTGAMAIDGDTLVVSANGEDSNATGVNGDEADNSFSASGAVYVFRRVDSVWQQEAYLKASNTGINDEFGASVAIFGDTIAVGTLNEDSAATGIDGNQDDNSKLAAGAVYIFQRTGITWEQESYLKASNTDAGDFFGASVSLGEDLLAVGAPKEESAAGGIDGDQNDNTHIDGAGAAYVFRRSAGVWSQDAYLKANLSANEDSFGASVAVAGNRIAVGSPGEDSPTSGINGDDSQSSLATSGAVYVFAHDGQSWSQEAFIKASNPGQIDFFGNRIAMSDTRLVVGAVFEDSGATGIDGDGTDNSAGDSGAAYIFKRTESTWEQEAYLKASNTEAGDLFGHSVAISASGNMVLIGAQHEGSLDVGVDGNQTDNSALKSGAAYLFHFDGSSWSQAAYFKASNTTANERFGNSVAVSDDVALAGTVLEKSAATGLNGDDQDNNAPGNAGAFYMFQ